MFTFPLFPDGAVGDSLLGSKLIPTDRTDAVNFGFSVSLSQDGTIALVGSNLHNGGGGTGFGAAYVFVRLDDGWTQQAKLQAADMEAGDYFGNSVSLSQDGTIALIGAPYEDTGGSSAGAAYIFTRSGSTWTQQAKIQAGDKQASDFFGFAVSLSGDGGTALVGAHNEDTGGTDAGATYVFVASGGTWTQQAKIQAGDKQANDLFGYAVSLSDNGGTALVGAHGEDTGAAEAGSAYVFVRSGSTWTEQAKIQTGDKQVNDRFGYAVSLSGDGGTAAIGAFNEDPDNLTDAGSAYIFVRSGSTWTEQAKLVASDRKAGDLFASSVAISDNGNTVLVSAPQQDLPGGLSNAGAAYVYTRSGTTWTQVNKLQASDAATNDQFSNNGVALSGDGGKALVGTRLESAAYVFGLS
jgi:hypothetical protein